MRRRFSLLALFGFLVYSLIPGAQAAERPPTRPESRKAAKSYAKKMKKLRKQSNAKWGKSGKHYKRGV